MKSETIGRKDYLYLFMHVPKCGGSTFVRHIANNFKPEEAVNLYRNQAVSCAVPGYEYLRNPGDVKRYFELLEDAAKEKIQVIYGHSVYYGIHQYFSKAPRYTTFLRDPVFRILSDYNMGLYLFDLYKNGAISPVQKSTLDRRYYLNASGEIKPFEEWINSTRTGLNHEIFFLNARNSCDREPAGEVTNLHLEAAKELLDKFYFVGITETFNDDAAFLYGKLGIQRFCKNHNVASKYYLPKNNKKMIDLVVSKNQLDRELYEYARKLNHEFKKKRKNFYTSVTRMKYKRLLSDLSGRTLKDGLGTPLGKTIRKFFIGAVRKMSHRCILILGCQRSGTTLLYMMLTSHPSIRGKNEDEASYRLPKMGPVLWNLMRAKYTCYKLPTKAAIPEFILKRFPGATILWIIRHPYAVISSMRSLVMNAAGENWLKISASDEMERLACLFPEIHHLDIKALDEVTLGAYVWKYKMMALERFYQIGLRPFVLKYEDLILHPRETLEPALAGLSLVWKDQVFSHEHYHAKKAYCGNNFGNRPLDQTRIHSSLCLDQRDMEKINTVCGDLIKKYYEH